jgi:hypothetical protein
MPTLGLVGPSKVPLGIKGVNIGYERTT